MRLVAETQSDRLGPRISPKCPANAFEVIGAVGSTTRNGQQKWRICPTIWRAVTDKLNKRRESPAPFPDGDLVVSRATNKFGPAIGVAYQSHRAERGNDFVRNRPAPV